MKIAFIFESAYPFTKGGAEKRIFEYSKHLSDRNEIEIVCMKWWEGDKEMKTGNIKHIAVCPRLDLYNSGGKRRILPAMRFGAAVFFYALRSDADVLDFEIFPYFPIIFGRIARFVARKKFVIIGHWCEFLGRKGWKKYSPSFWFIGAILEDISARCCDYAIAISNTTRDRLRECHPKIDISVIAPSGIDAGLIEGIPDPGARDFDIIYFGRLIVHKHVDYIVDLIGWAKSESVELRALIIGEGPDKKILADLSDKLGVGAQVQFSDFIEEYGRLIEAIKSAKMLILPSEREGFGISVIEANACGLPALVMRYPDNASVNLVENGQNGFVCKDRQDLLRKAIWLAGDEGKLTEMSQKSKESARLFDREKVGRDVVSFYRRFHVQL